MQETLYLLKYILLKKQGRDLNSHLHDGVIVCTPRVTKILDCSLEKWGTVSSLPEYIFFFLFEFGTQSQRMYMLK